MNLKKFDSLVDLYFFQAEKQNSTKSFLEWLNPKNKIKFTDIYNVVCETLNVCNPSVPRNLDDIIEIDKLSRVNALNLIKRKFDK